MPDPGPQTGHPSDHPSSRDPGSDERCEFGLSVRPGAHADALLQIPLADARAETSPGLDWLGGDFDTESWSAAADQLRWLVFNAADSATADAAPVAERLYRELIETLDDSAFSYPLRLWNFLPGINRGDGDDERYRRFCVGRGRALEAAGLADARMCAATAIGGDVPRMQLMALIGRAPGISIENPRQVSSWHYPRRYGPRQPAFARATAVPLDAERWGLLVSGTASVVGHATAHPLDTMAQVDEAARNLEALLAHAAGALGRSALERFDQHSLARVYVRRSDDWPAVERRLRARWPELALCGLRGDVCRSDLMVEIEAWHAG